MGKPVVYTNRRTSTTTQPRGSTVLQLQTLAEENDRLRGTVGQLQRELREWQHDDVGTLPSYKSRPADVL
ncbi:hypothetical protein EXIGLDRAFT_727846 [Exidia glandulosa HHB12029]|uniref:Uncharacterized protein n=1 Tax=Exidia glandulosa HHB12029 TaxID=1314781 RepID=A0A165LX15_EXIGL|nr:hypothetical protein EXIGLDRAFT_727846 [Exidia glandulosa HHB12029]